MASVRGAIENAKAIINDKRTKNSMDVLGEQVVINDDDIMEGGIHLTDSSNRISFKKKYFPDLTDNLLVDAIKVFKKVFGGRFPLTLTEHNPPCSEEEYVILIEGLTNRFQTLSNDIHNLNVQKRDAEQLRTKMWQLQKMRNFLYDIQNKQQNALCTVYDEDGSGDFAYSQYNDKLRKRLLKFILYSLFSFVEENADDNVMNQFFSSNIGVNIVTNNLDDMYIDLFEDTPGTNIDESDIPDFLTKWQSLQPRNNGLPGLVVQLLELTGNKKYNDRVSQQNLQLQKIKDSINRILGRQNTQIQTQAGGAIQIESLANLPNDLKEQINTIVSSSTGEDELVVNILAAVDKSYSELNKKNKLKNGELSNVIEFNEKYEEESKMTNEQLQTTSAELEKHANTNKELSDKNAELLVIKDKLEKINADQTQKLEELKTRFKGLIDMLNTHNKGLVDSTNNEIQSKVDSISKGSTEEVNKRLSELIQHILNSLETHIGKVNDVEASVAEPPPPTGGGKKRKIDIKQAIKYCKERLNPLSTLLTNIEKSVQNGALDAKKAKLKALNELLKDSPNKTPIKTQIQTLKSEIYKLKNTDTSIEGLLANMCE